MAPPAWVAGVLAVILLVIAGYCVTRLVMARWWRRSTDHGVDVMHAVMGVAMAGMLVPRLNPLQARAWAALFGAGAAWFGWQVLRDRRHRPARRARPTARAPGGEAEQGGHHGAHVLSCVAMVCMLLAAPDLSAPLTAGRGALPVLALLLAVAIAVSVVVSTDRISALPPAPVLVTPAQAAAVAPAPPRDHAPGDGAAPADTAPAGVARAIPGHAGAPGTRPAPAARPLLCPRLAACCQIVMGVAMAYMLILML